MSVYFSYSCITATLVRQWALIMVILFRKINSNKSANRKKECGNYWLRTLRSETKFAHKFFRDWFLYKYKPKIFYRTCPVMTFSFHVTGHRQLAQASKLSNHWGLKVTAEFQSGLLPFQGRWQFAAWHSLEHATRVWHQPLSQLLKILPWYIQWSMVLGKLILSRICGCSWL
jgi:hypothetical protein